MKNDLSNCKVGDWIWTIKDGWVQIVDNNYCDDYRIRTINSRGYTISGKRSSADKYPSAFLEPPDIFNAEPKPCEFKKGDRVLVRSCEQHKWERAYFANKSCGFYYTFSNGKDPWTGQGLVTDPWKYCMKWEETND